MEDDLFISKKELVTTIERLLYNISRNANVIASGGTIDYTPILQQIEQDLNTPNNAVPITEFNTGDYSTQPLLTQQYQNTQLLKSILACIGQATNISPSGLTIMGFIETFMQRQYFSTLNNIGSFNITTSIIPINILASYCKELIIDNRGTVPVYFSINPTFTPATGIKINDNERFVLTDIFSATSVIYLVTETGTTDVTIHTIAP